MPEIAFSNRLPTFESLRNTKPYWLWEPIRFGANAGIRTLDLRITNALLYQLSYIGLHS